MNRKIYIKKFGICDYHEMWRKMQDFTVQRTGITPDEIWLLQHPQVFTQGQAGRPEHLLNPGNIPIVQTDRGGQVTYHGPGQLMVYTLVDLRRANLGVKQYVTILEDSVIQLLADYGIAAIARPDAPGVYVDGEKICSIGLKIKHGCSYHGIALNVENDLEPFSRINPCGYKNLQMTKINNFCSVSMDEVADKLANYMAKKFGATEIIVRKPEWIRSKMPLDKNIKAIKNMLRGNQLSTVCEEAACPNLGECFGCGTATFMIMGNLCTRNCRFCNVTHGGRPAALDIDEPQKLASVVNKMKLKYVVITSVTRDDLPDGGAAHFRDCVIAVCKQSPQTKIEILTPDFQRCQDKALEILTGIQLDVFNHNIETVPRLYQEVRPGADYLLSLTLLQRYRELNPSVATKSGIMVGLGETRAEIENTLRDLRAHKVTMLTIGQYLRPKPENLPVVRYLAPQEFADLAKFAKSIGFTHVASGPMVRSSYHAERQILN